MRVYEHTMMSYAFGIATAPLGLYYNAYHFYVNMDMIIQIMYLWYSVRYVLYYDIVS